MTAILQTLTLLLVLFSGYLQAQNAVLCPAPNGLFVNPQIRTCRSFIRCTNGISVLQSCRHGTIFSGQQCIPGNQQTCNRVNANHFDDAFRGPRTTTPDLLGVITQPGVWNTGVQLLPGIWNNNGQTHNGQVNTGNPSNNGSPAVDGQIRGFNPGFLGAWFDANLQRTGDGQWPAVNVNNNRPSRGQTVLLNWPNVNTNTGNNQTDSSDRKG